MGHHSIKHEARRAALDAPTEKRREHPPICPRVIHSRRPMPAPRPDGMAGWQDDLHETRSWARHDQPDDRPGPTVILAAAAGLRYAAVRADPDACPQADLAHPYLDAHRPVARNEAQPTRE